MRRRVASSPEKVSGLVPMADILANTVGIILFILAFTVLHTGGVLIPKRLPMEREDADRKPVYFVCYEKRLLPLDGNLRDKLFKGLGTPTYETAESWVARFNRARVEDGFFTVEAGGEARFNRGAYQSIAELVLFASYKPKADVGDTQEGLRGESSLFNARIKGLSKDGRFLYFIVYPNSIELFREARDYAESQYGIASGWSPATEGEPITFDLSGNGGGTAIVPKPQP